MKTITTAILGITITTCGLSTLGFSQTPGAAQAPADQTTKAEKPKEDEKYSAELFIQECNSGIDYPTKGDESVNVKYAGLTYHMKILHPKVMEGPHLSTPFFWKLKEGESSLDLHAVNEGFLTLPTHIGGLYWYRIKGYFFAEKEGSLRGFFLENGMDNAQNGTAGLIFVYDGKKSTAWNWSYDTAPKESKGTYQITSADGLASPPPPHLLKALAPLLDLAEKEADAWQVFK